MKRAVVLLSGGLDSTTTLAIARDRGYAAYALSFDYGQRHRHELSCAAKVAEALGVESHVIIKTDALNRFGASALTTNIPVPKGRNEAEMGKDIPITYVPARNTIFLSFATAWAETLGAKDIFIGVNALDYSGYPDCRPEFIDAFERMANLATRAGVTAGPGLAAGRLRIHVPLIQMAKFQIIQFGMRLGVDYSLTSSCYDPAADGRPCGLCDSCLLRKKGFSEAGATDPLLYVNP